MFSSTYSHFHVHNCMFLCSKLLIPEKLRFLSLAFLFQLLVKQTISCLLCFASISSSDIVQVCSGRHRASVASNMDARQQRLRSGMAQQGLSSVDSIRVPTHVHHSPGELEQLAVAVCSSGEWSIHEWAHGARRRLFDLGPERLWAFRCWERKYFSPLWVPFREKVHFS